MPQLDSRAMAPWRVLDRRLLVSAPPWMQVIQERVQLPSDKIIDDFYRVVLPEFAVAVPVTDDKKFILVRGYKHGLGRVTLSPPAGLLDAREEPLHAAQRELLEETGYAAADWRCLGKFVVDGNRQCGTMHLFSARSAHLVAEPVEDESEELKIELLDRTEVLAALSRGEFGTLAGASAIALALVLDQAVE